MGRKIPAKKHRGVKDPLQQQAKRLQSVRDKINAPPRDPDEQPVPRSLIRLFQPLLQRSRGPDGPRIKHKRDVHGRQAAKAGPLKMQGRVLGESSREVARRIAGAVRALHGPSAYPGVDEDEEEAERAEDERAAKRRRGRGPPGVEKGDARPTRAQRRREKMKLKREDKQASAAAASNAPGWPSRDHVPFGEVAAAPPSLPAPPSLALARGPSARPGRRDLLLTALLRGGGGGGGGSGSGAVAVAAGPRRR